jgi:hypothetical protein
MAGCSASCLHRQLVEHYRIERERQLVERELVTGGYATELDEHGPVVSFRDWLVQHRR